MRHAAIPVPQGALPDLPPGCELPPATAAALERARGALVRTLYVAAEGGRTAALLSGIAAVDAEDSGNTNRAYIIFVRSLASVELAKLQSDVFAALVAECRPIASLATFCAAHAAISRRTNAADYYGWSEVMYETVVTFRASPDAQCELLEQIYDWHIKAGHEIEALSATMLQTGIVLEYMTAAHLMPNYFQRVHACSILAELCPMVSEIPAMQPYGEDLPVVPGFCDSFYFSTHGLCSLVSRAVAIYKRRELYDLVAQAINVLWPLLEFWHAYSEITALFRECETFFRREAMFGKDTTDTFWRVKFHGGPDDGKSFIYRSSPMLKLDE
ncbi:MAG: hypothetical protein LBL01_05645, partial [Bifidobacteriaceae bacterium]|nr:hypothetical protein [Bifidobacteriaceae bacterium]